MKNVQSKFHRRQFFKMSAFLTAVGTFFRPVTAAAAENKTEKPLTDASFTDSDGKKWFRGNTHMHSFRSDGTAFPDEAAALYKRLGYNFVVLTDHNSTHESSDRWVQLGTRRLTTEILERLEKNFPNLMPEKRVNSDGIPSYRLRTFDEMSEKLNESERFLLISGNEVSVASKNGDDLHCNVINTRKECRAQSLANTTENLDWTLKIRDEMIGAENQEAMFTVNHPLWKYFDVDPMDVARRPSIRFFEVANVEARPLFPVPEEAWTHDKFWDIVNAYRASRNEPLLFGIASDDTHNYNMFYETPLFLGYNMVQAESLTLSNLMHAFHTGNYYASTGLTLEKLEFDASSGTLKLAVHPEPGFKYTIQFIGTRRGFDPKVQKILEHQAEGEIPPWLIQSGFRPKRQIPVYSSEIGEVFQEIQGLEGSYTIQSEDLYVRAKIFTQKMTQKENEHPSTPIAWTQPVRRYK